MAKGAGSYTATKDADEPVRKGARELLEVSGSAYACVRVAERSGAVASRGQLKAWSSDEPVNALVGGESREAVDAAGAGQSLELVLASVF